MHKILLTKKLERCYLLFVALYAKIIKGVCALDANLLLDKIVEKGVGINETLAICNKIDDNNITIGDALWIKKVLGLTNKEAVKILLS